MTRDAQRSSGSPLAFVALLGGNAALAFGPAFVREADVGPVAAAFWRLALALPLLLAFAAWQWRSLSRKAGAPLPWPTGSVWGLALLGGVFFAADLGSWHLGILQTKMANATLFGNAASLILAVTTLLLARRLPRGFEGLALVLAFAGAVLLMTESSQQGQARLIGDLLCLLAGVLYAGYVLAMQRARDSLPSWPTLALSSAAGIVPLFLFATLLGERIIPGDWTAVLLLALTSQIIGQGLLIWSLPHFSALVVGLTLLSQPAIAAMAGWILYEERLSAIDLVGGLMVAVALVLIRLPQGGGNATAEPAR
ncbi:DMT family transporter [Sphingomonas lacunae]|uniref:DMT family transporter n=1 Tax=Sphingomonas lacunae TaxID=2698828 RepID=A0A6M4ATG8_9SPHN|nr:DMT family transporter [Sphingomonas lacunae]QJQ31720.1 DMT family transporter [Sphingomonas lacunae]